MPENSKPDDNGRPPPPTRPSSMAAKQIIDTIPSYISLYTHRSSPSPTANNPDRTAILRWFSSLSVHHRLSYLTIFDRSFSQLLLLMLSHLRSHGRGTFIVLPDIPSSSAPHLPTLCFRRSRGLLDRIAEFDDSDRLIRDSVRLFSSKEGESVKDCTCSSTCLDTVSFGEEFVADVVRFVDAMDRVSDSCFLVSDWGELATDWVEFEWLKAKGYYSMEAFVANRVEAALRLAWLNCSGSGGKKRGVKLKEKGNSVGVAANVFWRKKGCIDWWEKLELEVKRKALLMVLGKNTKSLIGEILKVTSKDSGGEMCVIAKGPHKPPRKKSFITEVLCEDMDLGLSKTLDSCSGDLARSFYGLIVLQEISHMILSFQNYEFDEDKLFFSSLDSVSALPDCILRKLRGLLMAVSLDSMKFDLFEEDDIKFPAKKKQGSTSRKKKGKNRGVKKTRPPLKESGHDPPIDETVQVSDVIVKPDEIVDTTKDIVKEEERQVLIKEKMQTVTRKSRKDRSKSRSSYPKLGVPKENNNSLNKVRITSSSCIAAQSEGNNDCAFGSSVRSVGPISITNEESMNVKLETARGRDETLDVNKDLHRNENGSENESGKKGHSEWPSVATDRLHLEVSHNWRNRNENIMSQPLPLPLRYLSTQELADDFDTTNWFSEEEYEMHAISCIDYNQHFGGGVMYWNPCDVFSRPPSLSSDDSSWAGREADMNRTVDDMVAFPSSFSTNGLHSPSAAPPFCSPFDDMADCDSSDAKSTESVPYPILRPIIIPRKRNHDLRSPRVRPRVKRPPSPVVLCVPHVSRPPVPSPVTDSRKNRGFPTVRSGSSSPRNWGLRTCAHMDVAELLWPTWGPKKLSPLTGTLLQEHFFAISHLTHDQEHPDVSIPLQPPELLNCPTRKAALPLIQSQLHEEIDSFCNKVAAENLMRRPYINWAVKRVTRSLQVLWPRSRTYVYGSNATGLSLPTSDVDLVVSLPPVRNLEPIKEAGILEGRNGIKETCLQHAARYLANQEWVKSDSLKTVENTAIPIIMLVVDVPYDFVTTNASSSQKLTNKEIGEQEDTSETEIVTSSTTPVHLDISFKSPSHTGLQTTQLVKELTEQFPAVIPLALVLKKFLADRSLDHAYSGGLSSYCLVLLITRFLQHEHHLGRAINQNLGGLLMDFLYFFGNVFDPRQMRISIQGSGLYINREKGYSIDPIYIDDPQFPTNNVGKNCFRIHQCIKAFADAYSTVEDELKCGANDSEMGSRRRFQLLEKIIASISLV